MTLALQAAKLLALLLLCAVLGETAWTIHRLRPKLEVTIENADRALIATGAAAGNVEKASRAWQASSKLQTESTTAILKDTQTTLASVRTFVANTDASLNTSVFPSITNLVNQQNQSLLTSQTDLQANLKEMLATTQQAQKILVDVDRQVSNPSVQASIDNLATATKNASEATQHLAGITKAGEETALYYQKKLETPESFLKTLAKFVLQLGSEARILFDK